MTDGLQPCDRLLFASGTYPRVYVHAARSGRPDCPITLAAAPGATPVLTGAPTYGVYVNLLGRSYWRLEGLTFAGTRGVVIASDGGSGHVLTRLTVGRHAGETQVILSRGAGHSITDSTFGPTGRLTDAGQGDHVYLRGVSGSLIARNRFTHAGHAAVDTISYVSGGVRTPSHHNVIRDNVIDQAQGGGGIGLIHGTTDTLVEGNVIRHAGGGVSYPKAAINLSGARNTIRRNVLLDTARTHAGLVVYAYTFAGVRQDATDNLIEYNTIARSGGPCLRMNQKDVAVNARNVIRRNLCVANRQAGPAERWRPPGLYDLTVELYHATGTTPWGAGWNGNRFEANWFALADGSPSWLHRDEPPWRGTLLAAEATWPEAFSGTRSGPVTLDAEGRPAPGSPAAAYGAHAAPTP